MMRFARAGEVVYLDEGRAVEILSHKLEQRLLRFVLPEGLVFLLEALGPDVDACGDDRRRDGLPVGQLVSAGEVIQLL